MKYFNFDNFDHIMVEEEAAAVKGRVNKGLGGLEERVKIISLCSCFQTSYSTLVCINVQL